MTSYSDTFSLQKGLLQSCSLSLRLYLCTRTETDQKVPEERDLIPQLPAFFLAGIKLGSLGTRLTKFYHLPGQTCRCL